jgi:hypothetical protein
MDVCFKIYIAIRIVQISNLISIWNSLWFIKRFKKIRKELIIWKSLLGPNLVGPFPFFSFFSISFSSWGPLLLPDQAHFRPNSKGVIPCPSACPCRCRHPRPASRLLPLAVPVSTPLSLNPSKRSSNQDKNWWESVEESLCLKTSSAPI